MPGEAIFYVYLISRPDGRPCYVGKGKGNRFKSFSRPHNRRLAGIIKKAGGELPVEIIKGGLCEAEAFQIERELIKSIGRAINGGPLVNLTDGGDGAAGLVQSADSIAKRIAKTTGKKRTAEQRARISEAHKGLPTVWLGRKHTPEARAKIGAAHKGMIQSDKCRESARQRMAGRIVSEETRAKLSLAQKGRPSPLKGKPRPCMRGRKLTAEHKAKIAKASLGRIASEETKQKMREVQRIRNQSEDYHKKLSAACVLREQRKRQRRDSECEALVG